MDRERYIPVLGHDWLTRFYDPLIRWTLRESTFKRQLVRQARIERGQRVLDLGCGTATLTLLIKKTHPDAQVVGLDGDPKILNIARAKAMEACLDVELDHGWAYKLPYPDNSFDRVLSSLLFHHLRREDKVSTLREVVRVLRPEGEFHLADWGKPQNSLLRIAFLSVQLLDGFETTVDHVRGLLPDLLRNAGFQNVQEPGRYVTPFGTLCLYAAQKAGQLRRKGTPALMVF